MKIKRHEMFVVSDSDTSEVLFVGRLSHVMDYLRNVCEEPWCGFNENWVEGFYKSKDKEPRCLIVEKSNRENFDLGVLGENEGGNENEN